MNTRVPSAMADSARVSGILAVRFNKLQTNSNHDRNVANREHLTTKTTRTCAHVYDQSTNDTVVHDWNCNKLPNYQYCA